MLIGVVIVISTLPTTNSIPHIHLVLKIMWENKTQVIVPNHQAPHSGGGVCKVGGRFKV
tara:strand:+ start:633 stop:809 length:177 start_codon:yes stop_codon:yes gene_type:complete